MSEHEPNGDTPPDDEPIKRILLVDDVELFLELQKSFFRRKGIQLLVARNGEEAYRETIRRRPDLIFMDLHMPVQGGDVCCRRIKQHPELSVIPVVMVTAATHPEDLQACREAGADAVIFKPLNRQQFLETAQSFLRLTVRVAPRVEARLPVSYGAPGRIERRGQTFNLSTGGLFIQSEEMFDLDTTLHLSFPLPPDNREVRCAARVAWLNGPESASREGYPHGMGVQFVGLALDDLALLRGFINREASAPPPRPF